MSKIITVPCGFFIDEVTAIHLNIKAAQARNEVLPSVALKPAKLAQAILSGADELEPFHELSDNAKTDIKATGVNLQQILCDGARVDYLGEDLSTIYSTTVGNPCGTDGPSVTLYFIPCEKTLSYTKRAYASKASVIREFSGYLGGLLPTGFDISSHICGIIAVGDINRVFRA